MADARIEGSMGLIRDINCRNCSQTRGCSAASRFDEALKKMNEEEEEKAELTGAGKQEKDEDKDKDAGKRGETAVERFGRRA
jgi:hypothetical protein